MIVYNSGSLGELQMHKYIFEPQARVHCGFTTSRLRLVIDGHETGSTAAIPLKLNGLLDL